MFIHKWLLSPFGIFKLLLPPFYLHFVRHRLFISLTFALHCRISVKKKKKYYWHFIENHKFTSETFYGQQSSIPLHWAAGTSVPYIVAVACRCAMMFNVLEYWMRKPCHRYGCSCLHLKMLRRTFRSVENLKVNYFFLVCRFCIKKSVPKV